MSKEGLTMNEIMTLRTENELQEAGHRNLEADFIRFLDVSARTLKTYGKALRAWARWLDAHGLRLDQATRGDVVSYRDELKASRKPATVNLYLGVVRLFYQWTETGGLYSNVARHVKGAKLAAGFKKDNLTSGQVRTIITSIGRESVKDRRDYAIFVLMASCGLRTIEVTRANLGDLRTVGDNRVLYVQGKGREEKDACIRVPAEVDAAIGAYLKAAGTPEDGEPLFREVSNHRVADGRLTTRSVSRIVKDRMKAAGFDSERLTAHSLRHTCATLMLLGGKTIQEAQQVMRHKSVTTTMIYSHNLDRMKNDGEQVAASAIFGSIRSEATV
jgi:integrase/recombinase XerC